MDTDYAALLWERLRQYRGPKSRFDDVILEEAASRIGEVDESADYGGLSLSFNAERFAQWLVKNDIPWPRTATGTLSLSDNTFRQMARAYPQVSPLRELRHSLSEMRLFDKLAVGSDGRNRTLLSPFRSSSGRNQPSSAKFIFGPSCWLRGLVRPTVGRAIAYVDWSQQEFGIAASLSGDASMQDAYLSADPFGRSSV